MGQFIIAGLLGLLGGILLAPKKGCELRQSIGERTARLWDKFFCALARNMEPAKPRSPEATTQPLAMGEITDESELAAAETLDRIKAALDSDRANHDRAGESKLAS